MANSWPFIYIYLHHCITVMFLGRQHSERFTLLNVRWYQLTYASSTTKMMFARGTHNYLIISTYFSFFFSRLLVICQFIPSLFISIQGILASVKNSFEWHYERSKLSALKMPILATLTICWFFLLTCHHYYKNALQRFMSRVKPRSVPN